MVRRLIKKLVDILLGPFVRLKVLRYPELPVEGGALLAVNHIHALDPVIISWVLYPKWLHHLAKVEIFRVPLLSQLVQMLGAIPVDRHRPKTDTARRAIDLLKKACYVCIFPQGTRRKKEFGDIKKGVARLALASNVPIYPVAITGLENVGILGIFKRPEVKILFGDPIPVSGRADTKEEVEHLVQELKTEMLKLYQNVCCESTTTKTPNDLFER